MVGVLERAEDSPRNRRSSGHPFNPDVNRLSEAISEPTDEEVQKLFNSMRPKLRRVISTPQSFYRFIDLLTASYGVACRRETDEGILVLKVAQQTTSAEPSAGEPAAESQAVLAQPAAGLDQELM